MKINPVHLGFGAEITDFDILGDVTPAEIDALRAAYDEYQLLVFHPGRPVAPERQVEINGWFGQVMSNGLDGKGNLWSVLANDDEAQGGGGTRRLPYHCDLSYTASPIKGLSLHALALPPAGTTTSFVSNIHAWETLSPERQKLLADKTLRHFERPMIPDWPDFIADHAVRQVHPRNGRSVLYVTEHHAQRIHELDQEASDALIQELFAHIYAPERVYEHQWLPHDLLIWDNLAIQHARKEEAAPEAGARAMQRVSLNDVGLKELLEAARRAEKERAHA